MKRKIYKLLKWVYSKLMRIRFIRKINPTVRGVLKKRKAKKIRKYKENTIRAYKNVTADECNIKEITLTHKGNECRFGFDAVGLITGLDSYNYIEYCSSLNGILDNEEIDCRVAVINEKEKAENRDAVDYFENVMKLISLSPGEGVFINCGEVKVLFFAFNIVRGEELTDYQIDEELVKKIAFAENHQVNYLVGYGLREDNPSIKATPYERQQIRALSNLGCDYILGANESGIYKGRDIKKADDNITHVIWSVGGLFGSPCAIDSRAKDASIAVRVRLTETDKGASYVTNQGYIPIYNIKNSKPYKDVVRIDYHNHEHRRNKDIMEALSYIEDETNKLRDIRNILTINDICKILHVDLPEKYLWLGNISVGKVCARSFEVENGDVMFFREPFDDPNDGEPKPLNERMRIVEKAMARGARFIFSYGDLGESIPHIKISNCREAHIEVCARLRKMYEVRTIGITGSVGKTSTKDMLFNVLSEKYVTEKNLRNSNTQVNIGLHVQDFKGRYEIFIQEIGGGRPGGASRHSRMILPEATVVTNIGHAHIGNFGTQESLMQSKLGIIDGMNHNGTLYLNGDDPLLITAEVPADTVFFAVHNHDVDYYADNIKEEHGQTHFEIVHGEHRVSATLNVLGEYNVLNAVCCYAIGKKFKLTDEEIVVGISKFETSGMRQNLMSVGGYNLFVDCFNASPHSIDSSLSVLEKIETDKKKIAVIGDVTGMADLSNEIHIAIGNIVKKHNMDILVCYGEESRIVYDMAKAADMNAYWFDEPKPLTDFLKKNFNRGDVALFKGSSKTLLSERIDELFGTMLSDQRYIDSVKFKSVKADGISYYVYPTYATVRRGRSQLINAKIFKHIRGVKVFSIADGAFSDLEELESIKLPKTIRHIGAGGFSNCGALKKMVLPESMKFIGECAFSNCTSLKNVVLNDGLMHIAPKAFENCISLESIELPASIQEMGEGVFEGCDNITVFCPKNSYAERYCINYGVEYKVE